jgi:Flp pilus assembly protein TadG
MHARIRRIRYRLRSRRWVLLHRFTKEEQGIQLVEAAIVIPIFLILFAATAEFGRFFYEYTTLSKAVRGGARYLSSVPLTEAEKTAAKNMVVYGTTTATGTPVLTGLDPSHVNITQSDNTVLPDTITLEVSGYTYEPIFDLGLLTATEGLSLNIDVSPSITMRFVGPVPPLE